MITDDECVGYARECARLAALTTNNQIREQLMQLAREWMAFAMHEKKVPAPRAEKKMQQQQQVQPREHADGIY